MKYRFCLLLLITLLNIITVNAQYREMFDKYPFRFFQQPDSVYKNNKVKARNAVSSSFNARSLMYKHSMDKEGRITAIMYPPFMSVQTKTTQFTYTETGKLLQVQDVFVKGKDSKFYQEVIASDKKLRDKYKAMPDKVYYTYHIKNVTDTIKLITRLNEKGDTLSQSTFTNKGLTHQYKEFGKYEKDAVTNYIDNSTFVYLPVSLSYKSLGQPYYITYEYFFDGQNRIEKLITKSYSFDETKPYNTDTYNLVYANNGLLLSAKSNYQTYEYEYEFYK